MNEIKIMWKYLQLLEKRLAVYLLSILMMMSFYALFEVSSSLFVKKIFDIAESGSFSEAFPSLLYYMLLGVISICIAATFMYIYNNEAKKGAMAVKKHVFEKSMKLPMQYYDTHHSGDFISRLVYDTDKASDIYTSRLRRVAAPIISVIIYVVIMLCMNPAMTSILIVFNIILLLLNTFLSDPMKKTGSEMAKKNSSMTEKLTNMLMGIELSKMNDYNHITRKKYEQANEEFVKIQKKKMYISGILETFFTGFDILCGLMFLVIGLLFLQKNWISIGEIAAIYTMYGIMSNQFLRLGKYYPELVNCIAFAERIFDFLKEEEETEEPQKTKGLKEKIKYIENSDYNAVEIKQITFQYEKNQPVLDHFSMVVPKQKHVALVGKSGCGKSTIAKLLLGLYQNSDGEIQFFGKSMYELGVYQVRELISYVPQEPYLFEVSIMENIRYGKLTAADEEVYRAAKLANAHDFILMQENGYQTILKNKGQSLSGGERQRIAVARAILKDAPIILFDEATSGLDNETEFIMQKVMEQLKCKKTIVEITHKKSMIDKADCIIHIETHS